MKFVIITGSTALKIVGKSRGGMNVHCTLVILALRLQDLLRSDKLSLRSRTPGRSHQRTASTNKHPRSP